MFTDRDDLAGSLSAPDETVSERERLERVTASFDSQVETGVRAALERDVTDLVPEDVSNELALELGDPVQEMGEEELATLPRQTLDLLFRRGDLGNAEYARVMELKLGREENAREE